MKCPICNIDLIMSERFLVEIDYCPKCRGIWLDRGELDKIIEKSLSQNSYDEKFNRSNQLDYSKEHNNDHDGKSKHETNYYQNNDKHYDEQIRNNKKRSFISDLFDF